MTKKTDLIFLRNYVSQKTKMLRMLQQQPKKKQNKDIMENIATRNWDGLGQV